MADSSATLRGAVGAAAAAVLVARVKDFRHVPRLVLDSEQSPAESLKIVASALVIYGYERLCARILRALGLTRMPSTLAAMLSLFAGLRTLEKVKGRADAERVSRILKPGVDFLGKWMGAFLAPPLVSLDKSVAALPRYSGRVWANTIGVLFFGWASTHMAAGAVATTLAPKRAAIGNGNVSNGHSAPKPASRIGEPEVPLDEAVRRSWVVLGAASYLGVSCMSGSALHRPLGMACEACTTIGSLALSKLLPDAAQRVLHPLVICAVSSNLSTRFVGDAAPYFDAGAGVGDRLFQWLPAAVTGLGVRMFNTTPLWLDDASDFKCVLATCSASGAASMAITAITAVAPLSPLSVPAPLSLPMLHRSVMSALGIEGSEAIGPECDPKLAVASILITGCIGASLGNTVLEALPVFNSSSSLVRGVAMGCSAHSIGTAGLISNGDTEAAAISG